MHTERTATIALNMIPGIGTILARNCAETFGSLSALFAASAKELLQVPGIGQGRAETLYRALHEVDVEAELARARDTNVTLLTLGEPAYPRLLREIHDPPLVLYVQGSVEALDTACVAMVGTRSPTQYGRETARRFAFQLAQAGVTVVSGLARGIDTESHQASLQAKGRTIAVLGSALNEVYPRENVPLAQTIATSNGAVISEYPFGRKADRQTFPMRNRIVSGLCRATVVIEAGISSGTLITAHQALEQGRSILAVPGRIDNPMALGCHKLLQQGARLADCVDDILEEMQSLRLSAPRSPTPRAPVQPSLSPPSSPSPVQAHLAEPAPPLDDTEKALLAALKEADGEAEVELLLARTGLPAYRVNAKLISLEMKRKIQQLPGRRVALVR